MFLCVGSGLLFDERPQSIVIRLNPVRHEHPFLAVPLLDARGTASLVISRAQFYLLQQTLESDARGFSHDTPVGEIGLATIQLVLAFDCFRSVTSTSELNRPRDHLKAAGLMYKK
jgi:hypothetical protein